MDVPAVRVPARRRGVPARGRAVPGRVRVFHLLVLDPRATRSLGRECDVRGGTESAPAPDPGPVGVVVRGRARARSVLVRERRGERESREDPLPHHARLGVRLEHGEHARYVSSGGASHDARAVLEERDERAGERGLEKFRVEFEARASARGRTRRASAAA